MLKKLAPLGSLDKSPFGSIDKPALGSIDNQSLDRSSADSHSGSFGRPNELIPNRLNKPLLGSIDQKALNSIDKSSISSKEKSPIVSPLRKPRARDKLKEERENVENDSDLDQKIQIGDSKLLQGSPTHSQSSSLISAPPKNSLRIGSNRSFLKTNIVVNSEEEEEISKSSVIEEEQFDLKGRAQKFKEEQGSESPVRGILKGSPAKSNSTKDPESAKTLRQAMLQRDEKRIMFDLDKNIEFASEVCV